MTIYHTSPTEIKKIHNNGRYGPGLFFASQPYSLLEHDDPHIYELELDEDEIIEASHFSYLEEDEYKKIQHIVKNIMNYTSFDEEAALRLLSQKSDVTSFYYDLEHGINRSDDDESEEFSKKKELYKHLSKIDLGEMSWDLQRDALLAANILGKKGVALPDET